MTVQPKQLFRAATMASLVLGSACSGTIAGGGDLSGDTHRGTGGSGNRTGGNGVDQSGGSTFMPPGPTDFPESCEARPVPGVPALRRLSHTEYANTLRDVLNLTVATAALPAEGSAIGFENAIDDLRAPNNSFGYALQGLSEATAQLLSKAAPLVPCAGTQRDRNCAQTFATEIGQRAFRRPLTSTQQQRYMKVYDAGAGVGGFDRGIEWMVTAILQSPYFLYQTTLPEDLETVGGNTARVRGYAMASRLSYFLWASAPDDKLLAAAESGALGSNGELVAQVERMLADPRGHRTTEAFYSDWLDLEAIDSLVKDTKAYPSFTPALGQSFKQEILHFVNDVTWDRKGGVSDLFSLAATHVDDNLAKFYGVNAPGAGKWAAVDLPANERFGLITMPGVLAMYSKPAHSSPVARGRFILDNVLCYNVPDPPPDVNVTLPVPAPDATVRQQLEVKTSTGSCKGCHQLLNPLGFALEAYDGLGQHRTVDESGLPVDTSGKVEVGDISGSFEGMEDLSVLVKASGQPAQCASQLWFRYAFGRAEADDDECLIAAWSDTLKKGGSLVDLLSTITLSEPFVYATIPQELQDAVGANQ